METDYEALIYVTVHELFTNLEKRFDHESMERIRAGFAFAKEAHKTQKRNSGEPYIFHPIAVARIIGEELMLGTDTIIAAFLQVFWVVFVAILVATIIPMVYSYMLYKKGI